LTNLKKEELLNNLKIAKNETTSLWVYKKMENKLVLINSNTPSGAGPLASWRQPEASFSSKHLAAKELNISTKTISKFLNIHKDYKGLYFYSIKV
jgi:hypothetical protein